MRSKGRLLIVAMAGAATVLAAFAIYLATSTPPTFADVAYGQSGDRNRLDIYLPPIARDPQPVVVLVHGGGFRFGDEARRANLGEFLEAGFAVAAINYRLSNEAIWPAQLIDVTDAIRYLHDNAASFGIDPARMAAFGQSAGGHLALSTAA